VLPEAPDACVRGVEQQTLRFIVAIARDQDLTFVILQPFSEGDQLKFIAQEHSANDIAEEYLSISG
jgi:hypothetical protein